MANKWDYRGNDSGKVQGTLKRSEVILIEEEFEKRCRITTDINQHLPLLRKLASTVDHVTEFGVREGHSTVALACGRPAKMVSYDINRPSLELLEQLMMWLPGFQFIQANTLDVDIEPTDLLFIDSYHTYRQLWRELALHHDKVSKYIVLHDTNTYGEVGEDGGLGLNYAIAELLELHPEWRITNYYANNNGLTVLSNEAD